MTFFGSSVGFIAGLTAKLLHPTWFMERRVTGVRLLTTNDGITAYRTMFNLETLLKPSLVGQKG